MKLTLTYRAPVCLRKYTYVDFPVEVDLDALGLDDDDQEKIETLLQSGVPADRVTAVALVAEALEDDGQILEEAAMGITDTDGAVNKEAIIAKLASEGITRLDQLDYCYSSYGEMPYWWRLDENGVPVLTGGDWEYAHHYDETGDSLGRD